MDKLDPIRRSENMRRIRSKDTKPELIIRSRLHRLGYRFRLHRKDLPGKPDIVFPSRRKAIFVHGCFWHQHSSCREGRVPATRREYWLPKLQRNLQRDKSGQRDLARLGWKFIVVWECQLQARQDFVIAEIIRFLDDQVSPSRSHSALRAETT